MITVHEAEHVITATVDHRGGRAVLSTAVLGAYGWSLVSRPTVPGRVCNCPTCVEKRGWPMPAPRTRPLRQVLFPHREQARQAVLRTAQYRMGETG